MTEAPCSVCGCSAPSAAHAIAGCLQVDDVDGAIDAGLLDVEVCDHCAPVCTAHLVAMRDQRRVALAARERFRARERRLARGAAEREAARNARPAAATTNTPPLPPAAAAALQRALARAKGPTQ